MGSTLLCAIVERKTGIPTEEYLKSRLFVKIGIDSDNFLFERMPDGTVFGGEMCIRDRHGKAEG